MERESQRLLESVMKLIAAQFGPDCEVVLHDWSKDYESTIVAIENGHVYGWIQPAQLHHTDAGRPDASLILAVFDR